MSSGDDSNGEDPAENDVDEAQNPPRSPAPEVPIDHGAGGDAKGSNLPPRSRGLSLPPRPAVLQRMRQVRELYGFNSGQWNALQAWIDSRYDAYIGIYDDLAREDRIRRRNRERFGSSGSKLDDPDKTDSDSSGGPSRRTKRRGSSAGTDDDDAEHVTGQQSSGSEELSLAERKQASFEALSREEVLTVMCGKPDRPRRVRIRCSSVQPEHVKTLAANNTRNRGSKTGRASGSRSSAPPVDESGYIGGNDSGSGGNDAAGSRSIFDDCLPESPSSMEGHEGINLKFGEESRSGEGNSGKTKRSSIRCAFPGCSRKHRPLAPYCHSHTLSDENRKLYKPCQFIVDRGEKGKKMCGSPVPNTPQLHYCADHMQQAAALERENVASSPGTSLPDGNEVVNQIKEESKPSEQHNNSSPMDEDQQPGST